MGIHHSPHTHRTPIPMGIPIPTAALSTPLYLQLLPLYPALSAPQWLQAEPSSQTLIVAFGADKLSRHRRQKTVIN